MISIVTAVAPLRTHWLGRALASLRAQDEPWEWLLQLDGPSRPLSLPADERVRLDHNGRHLGVSATRNRALLRARGRHVLALDADDELLPGALSTLAAALRRHSSALYALGESADLFPDGRRLRRFAHRPYPSGELTPGQLESVWRSTSNLHVQPGAVLYRRDAVLAVGGWPAITGMEDQDLLLAVAALAPGVFVDSTVYLYRQHPGQTVRTATFEREILMHRAWSHARLRALRALHGEDETALAGLVTPVPGRDDLEGLTTDEWRAATASQLAGS